MSQNTDTETVLELNTGRKSRLPKELVDAAYNVFAMRQVISQELGIPVSQVYLPLVINEGSPTDGPEANYDREVIEFDVDDKRKLAYSVFGKASS